MIEFRIYLKNEEKKKKRSHEIRNKLQFYNANFL